MKLRNKKGFTLMEMLIVVAIIAILVAIAIPTFTNALYKAKLAADKANIRAAYAEAVVIAMVSEDEDALNEDGEAEVTTQELQCDVKDADKWIVPGSTDEIQWEKGGTVTITCDPNDGTVTVTVNDPA